MNQKKMERIIRRDKRRKRAQGIGAAAGTITSLLVLGVMYGLGNKIDKKTK
jgi:hypothetical protein